MTLPQIMSNTIIGSGDNSLGSMGTSPELFSIAIRFLTSLFIFIGIGVPSATANNDELIEYGKYLSEQCVTCHQPSTKNHNIPPIVGWDPQIFIRVMDAYRKKERENNVMQTISAPLTDEDVKALAFYFSTLKTKDE